MAAQTNLAEIILDKSSALFREQGYAATTIKQIAKEASVSEQTIYNVFKDKTGLLVEVGMYAMSTGDGGEDGRFLQALASEPDPLKRIEMAARYSKNQWQEGALELDLMLFGGDSQDPRIIDLAEKVLAYKFEVNRAVLQIIFPDEVRRPEVSLDEIAAFATTVESASTITTLRKLGWSMDQYEGWLVTLLSMFLDPSAPADEGTQPA